LLGTVAVAAAADPRLSTLLALTVGDDGQDELCTLLSNTSAGLLLAPTDSAFKNLLASLSKDNVLRLQLSSLTQPQFGPLLESILQVSQVSFDRHPLFKGQWGS
jgi:hypothetical protein